MHSAKLVTQLLLAVASLGAAAHRPGPGKHQPTASRHQLASSKQHKPASKHVTTASKHRKAVRKSSRAAARQRPASKRLAVAASRHHAAKKHPAKKLLAKTSHRTTRQAAAPQAVGRTYNVIATVYQAVPGQTDSSPFITADNSRIRPRYGSGVRWLALSPDLLKQGGGKFHYGDKVQVSRVSPQLDGVYTVHDTMNRRHRHRIDILTHRREKLHVFAPGAKLRLAQAPRKSRAQATAAAHARPGRKVSKLVAGHQIRKPGRQQAG
jgi:3D (Asp-Asp-Asp) domain-containing protein